MNEQKLTRKEFDQGIELFAKIVGGQQDWKELIPKDHPSPGHAIAQMALAFTQHLALLKKTGCVD